jgi:hypothetical protein
MTAKTYGAGRWYGQIRVTTSSGQQLDQRTGEAWTFRQLAFHPAGSADADSVGVVQA